MTKTTPIDMQYTDKYGNSWQGTEFRTPKKGDFYITNTGDVIQALDETEDFYPRVIVHRIATPSPFGKGKSYIDVDGDELHIDQHGLLCTPGADVALCDILDELLPDLIAYQKRIKE